MPDDCTLQVKHAVCLELKKMKKYAVLGSLYITFFLSDTMGCLK